MDRKINLINLTNMPGYLDMVAILEEHVESLKEAVFQIDPADEKRTLAAVRIAIGAEWAVQKALHAVAVLVADAPETGKQMTHEEEAALYLKSLQ